MSDGDKVILLGCARSAGEALQAVERGGGSLPGEVEYVELACGGALDELMILQAYEHGARAVLVACCCEGACRSLDGSRWAQRRVAAARRLLNEVGIAEERLALVQVAPNMPADLLAAVQGLLTTTQLAAAG